MDNRMIMTEHAGLTFMYRVGGIMIHDRSLLVERSVDQGFCFLPGGRVEFGESAGAALQREAHEELGEAVTIGRLALVIDNLFAHEGRRYQEVGLYFLMELTAQSPILDRRGPFAGAEPNIVLEWVPLAALKGANLLPPCLCAPLRDLPAMPLRYLVRDELAAGGERQLADGTAES